MQKKKNKLKIKTMNALSLPPETMLGGIVMRIYDNTGCSIEGEYHMVNYTDANIVIEVEFCKISFEGKKLLIEEMTANTLSFTGQLTNIRYMGIQKEGTHENN